MVKKTKNPDPTKALAEIEAFINSLPEDQRADKRMALKRLINTYQRQIDQARARVDRIIQEEEID